VLVIRHLDLLTSSYKYLYLTVELLMALMTLVHPLFKESDDPRKANVMTHH